MQPQFATAPWSPPLMYELLLLLFALIALVLCLRIVWRVEKKLDVFFKCLAAAIFVLIVYQLAQALIAAGVLEREAWTGLLPAAFWICLIGALVVFNAFLNKLNRRW